MHTTQKTVEHYERRVPNPALDVIERAAEALEVSVAELSGSQPYAKPASARRRRRKNSSSSASWPMI